MIKNKDFIYLDLEKTACSHIRKLILKYFEDAQDTNKHKVLCSKDDIKNKTIIGSVRHPYDWYVSHYLYGFHKGGAIRHSFKRKFKNHIINMSLLDLYKIGFPPLKKFYKNESKDEFKKWLFSIMSNKSKYFFNKYNYQKKESYFHSNSFRYHQIPNQKIGLFTHHFLNMYFINYSTLHPNDFCKVNEYSVSGLLPEHFIKVENLESDFYKVFSMFNTSLNIEDLKKQKKTNALSNYKISDYLDEECKTLIRQKDNYIFELFDYNI